MSNIQQIEEQIDKIQNNNMKLFEIFQTVMELPENKTPETLKVTPTKEYQEHRGLYDVVTVDGEPNLVSENIKEGTSIFGVEGSAKTINAVFTNGEDLFSNNADIKDLSNQVNEFVKLCDWKQFTSCKYMFSSNKNLTSLAIRNASPNNVTNMSGMFSSCSNLTKLDFGDFNTNNVTNMGSMFSMCGSLTELDLSNFDTSNVTNMSSMFSNCKSLTDLDLSSFDMSKVADVSSMFNNCGVLTNLKFGANLGKAYTQKNTEYYQYTLSVSSEYLTHDSLMNIINNLYDLNLSYDVANGGTLYRQELYIGYKNRAKLTEEEIAIATNKGWNVT